MSDLQQRQQWAEHLEDEAGARLEQQAAAGPDHGPVAGPLPFSADDLEQAHRGAIAHERERCARLAESWVEGDLFVQVSPPLTEDQRRAIRETASRLAAAIRAG